MRTKPNISIIVPFYNEAQSVAPLHARILEAMQGGSSSSARPSGVQGVCPNGWHLPSEPEWNILMNAVGGRSVAGARLKAKTSWYFDNNGDDRYGFAGLASGYRNSTGLYSDIKSAAYWWSCTALNTSDAWNRFILYGEPAEMDTYSSKRYSYPVRCVRN